MVTTIKITCDGVFIQSNSFLTPSSNGNNSTNTPSIAPSIRRNINVDEDQSSNIREVRELERKFTISFLNTRHPKLLGSKKLSTSTSTSSSLLTTNINNNNNSVDSCGNSSDSSIESCASTCSHQEIHGTGDGGGCSSCEDSGNISGDTNQSKSGCSNKLMKESDIKLDRNNNNSKNNSNKKVVKATALNENRVGNKSENNKQQQQQLLLLTPYPSKLSNTSSIANVTDVKEDLKVDENYTSCENIG